MANARYSFDESGNMFIEGIAVTVKPNSYKVSDAFKNAINDMELQLKNSAITEEEFYKNTEKLRNQYLEKGTKEWWNYTNKIISYENKREKAVLASIEKEKKEIEKLYNDMYKTICKEQEKIANEQEKFAQKLSGYTEPFYTTKKIFIGQGENGHDLVYTDNHLQDLDKSLEMLKNYKELLSAVKNRGNEFFGKEGFADFFDMLRTMSIDEGATFASLLLKEDDEGFKDYIGDWNELQSYAAEFSKQIYEDEAKAAMDKSIKYMEESLAECGLEIPEGFFTSGSISAEKFGDGFISQIDSVMKSISDSFNMLMPNISLADATGSMGDSKVFSPTYNFYGGGESTLEKLHAAQAQATLEKLRGGY